MADINPYAAPQHEVVVSPLPVETSGGVWRDGKLLVMHKQAVLPDRCVKCNQPAGGRRRKRSLSWHHPGYFLLVLASVLVYVIMALVVRQTAKIEIGMCEIHRRKRWQAIATSWLLVLIGILAIFGGGSLIDAPAKILAWLGPWPPFRRNRFVPRRVDLCRDRRPASGAAEDRQRIRLAQEGRSQVSG